MKHRIVVAGVLLALALPPPALAQSTLQLQLPSAEDTYREMQQEQRSGPCDRCGVVYRTRTENRQGPGRRDPGNAAGRDFASPDAHLVDAGEAAARRTKDQPPGIDIGEVDAVAVAGRAAGRRARRTHRWCQSPHPR
ncbi:MAG: hypothetical protein J5W83_02330 [Candidatus Accumulibacter sp.]|uniref:hypothetical protein n=1 Tax=Accumulibacter sp. TaxID=2053492 RepID=UPI001B2C6CCC|nr:hypothetical protein [Accumulibacter sp.]MBO3701369.1 hypothetical protein [Accumulibacter sp.]